jgi:polyphosphate kinase
MPAGQPHGSRGAPAELRRPRPTPMALVELASAGAAGRSRPDGLARQPRKRALPGRLDPSVMFDDRTLRVSQLVEEHRKVLRELEARRDDRSKAAGDGRPGSKLRCLQVELLKLQKHLEVHDMRMIVLFEGRDAAGKGGAIRRVTRFMNEKRCRVVALGRPTEEQRSQWYFQRYVSHFPCGGEIVLFDRSWYNRAMVEPVFGFCTPEEYRNFMLAVTGFERDLVRQGTILVKLYFSVTKQEQARRFARRSNDPLRQWKLSEIDMEAEDRWDEFTDRKYEMLVRTSTRTAPWVIVRSGDKQRARVNAIKVILNAVDYDGRDPAVDLTPDPEIVLPGSQEIALMEAQRVRSGRFTD